MGKKHAPSAYRKILRDLKSGKVEPTTLARRAGELEDSYYTCLALFAIAADNQVKESLSKELRVQATALIVEEKRGWRRAELIAAVAKSSPQVSGQLIGFIRDLSEPKARADAISGSAKNMGCESLPSLLEIGLETTGFEMEACRPVVKLWASECPGLETMIDKLEHNHDSEVSIRLLGYLQLQMSRSGIHNTEPMEKAVEISLKQDDSLEMLKYLAAQSEDIDSLEIIAASLSSLEGPLEEAGLLVTLAGSADKAGERDLSRDWFDSASQCLDELEIEEAAGTRLNLAQGYERLGLGELADRNYKLALEGSEHNQKLRKRIEKAMGFGSNETKKSGAVRSSRHVLALYDTYQGKFSSAHMKMLATAAPLCIAYGLDLGLVDFPGIDIDKMVKKTSADTNIGKGGRYLGELSAQGRILLISSKELDKAGLPIATTSNPRKEKMVSLEKAAKIAESHSRKRLCVMMGLGRKGLSRKLLESVEYHAEITGSNVALETSTAMGIIAQLMGRLPRS